MAKLTVQGIEVQVGDVVYGVTSAPAHGKWGGYSHAVGYRVEEGKTVEYKLVKVWDGPDHTSENKCWDDAKSRASRTTPLNGSNGKRVLLTAKGAPSINWEK